MSAWTRRGLRIALALATTAVIAARWRYDVFEKNVAVVEPGRLIRGAWQRPGPLRRLLARERIRTIVTLTAINRDDPKYRDQEAVVRETGVDWVIVPMRGSTATPEQMVEAADLLADPARQPVFFHCVGGHHRSSLAQAAYRIHHEGWSADRAWREVASLPCARPSAPADRRDRARIEAFAEAEGRARRSRDEPPQDGGDAEGRGSRGERRPSETMGHRPSVIGHESSPGERS